MRPRDIIPVVVVGLVLSLARPGLGASSECTGARGGREGDCAPDFTLKTIQGEEVRLSDFRGKVVFLNFWATWCEPCRVEIPALNKAYHDLKDKGVVLLAASIDSEGHKAIDPFFGKDRPAFPILLDSQQEVSRRYGTFKVPETYIIDRSGRIRDKVEGIRDWSDRLIIHYLTLLAGK